MTGLNKTALFSYFLYFAIHAFRIPVGPPHARGSYFFVSQMENHTVGPPQTGHQGVSAGALRKGEIVWNFIFVNLPLLRSEPSI